MITIHSTGIVVKPVEKKSTQNGKEYLSFTIQTQVAKDQKPNIFMAINYFGNIKYFSDYQIQVGDIVEIIGSPSPFISSNNKAVQGCNASKVFNITGAKRSLESNPQQGYGAPAQPAQPAPQVSQNQQANYNAGFGFPPNVPAGASLGSQSPAPNFDDIPF